MLQIIIAILMSLGYLSSAEEWNTISSDQQNSYIEIIEDEIHGI